MQINKITCNVSNVMNSKTANVIKKAAVPVGTLIAGGAVVDKFLKVSKEEQDKKDTMIMLLRSMAINSGMIEKKGSPEEQLKLQGLNDETINRVLSAKTPKGKPVFDKKGVEAFDKVKYFTPAYSYLLSNAENVDKVKNYNSTLAGWKNGVDGHITKDNKDIDFKFRVNSNKYSGRIENESLNIRENDNQNNILTEYERIEEGLGKFRETKKTYDMTQNPPKLINVETLSGNKYDIERKQKEAKMVELNKGAGI